MAALEFHYTVNFACIGSVVYNLASMLLARNIFMGSNVAQLFHAIQSDLRPQTDWYEIWIEATTVAVVCYIGLTDFRTLRIHNLSLGLLLLLYLLYAGTSRSLVDIFTDVLLCAIVFAALLWFYGRRAIGGGDVKLLSIICLWIGTHCAVLFSVLFLFFIIIHMAAVKVGWTEARYRGVQWIIPYAPSMCAAFVFTVLLGCL